MSALDPNGSPVLIIPASGGVASTRSIATTSPITGGGDLSADRTFALDASAARTAILAVDPGMPSSAVVDWRASDLVLSDGAAVSSWAPSTGTGTLTGSGSARPTFRLTGTPSGAPAVEFDGSDDRLTLAGVAGLSTGASAGTLVAIVSRIRPASGGSGYQHFFQYGEAASVKARGLAVTNAALYKTHEWASSVTSTYTPGGFGTRVIGHTYDGTVCTYVADGVDAASYIVTLNTGTSGGISVGSNLSGGELGTFRLIRLTGYTRVLTAAEWAQTVAHARAAYGLL